VIVESPNKCATIAKILNQYAADNNLPYEYQVTSCMGHIRNLPQKKERAPRKKKSATPTANATTADNNVVVSKFPYKVTGIDLDHNYTPTYVILEGKQQLVRDLTKLAHAAEMVCLATDPDREGEAMAWHLMQVLQLPDNMYQRITFSELTQSSIVSAVEHPVQLNTNLVHAQETRRILDRLAGFTVSPILWKKIAPGLSAGRVQSVGMALTVRRERERLVFEETEYWDLQAVLQSGEASDNSPTVTAMLQSVNGTALANVGKDFASQGRCLKPEARHKLHLDQERADDMAQLLRDDQTTWKVLQVQSRQRKQQSPLPYRTSTLQQEANRRLGMPIQQIMRTAQQLYEQGLISYMRTDSSHLSTEAQTAIGKAVRSQFGPDMIAAPDVSGGGKKKKEDSKFAQEAHEAIRPAIQSNGGFLQPEMISEKAAGLSEQAKSLYRLIYQRTLAHRMPSLVTNQTKVVIEGISADETINVQFRVSGSVVVEPGYTMVYGQTKFDEEGDEPVLPPLAEGQSLKLQELLALGHQTQPPPRYTEASFVKELEALGVGRPSTYAGVVQILRDRAYVGNPIKDDRGPRKSTKAVSGPAISAQRAAGGEEFTGGGNARGPLVPSLSAFVVCSLFEKHCPTYVDPSFTAQMEGRLDLIASGDESSEVQRIAYLDEFYAGDNGLAAQIKRIEDNVSADEARRASLPSLGRKNTTAIEDEVALFIGPWGPYVQKTSRSDDGSEKPPTASLPPGLAADISKITPRTLNAVLWSKESGGLLLGTHPDDGRDIRLKTGRFGAYLQWGEDEKDGTTTHSLPRDKAAMRSIESFAEDDDADSERMSLSGLLGISLEEAIGYVGLPRRVTTLNELPVVAAIGPYGPYLKYNSTFLSLNQKDGDVLSIDADTAERLVTDGIINAKDKKARGVVAEIGERDDSMVTVKDGRFGVYINWKNVNAKLPFNYASNPSELPLDEAWTLIQHKASSAPTSKGGRKSKKSCKTKDVLDDLPPVPKRPLSAYLHFCAAKRPEVSSKIKKLGDISKKLAELWGATSTEDRKEYDAAAAVGKANYEKAKKAWKVDCQTIPEGTKSGGRKGVKSKKASAPSKTPRAPNAYILFCREHRHTIVDQDGVKLPLGETTKRLAALWNVCDEETRAQFQQQASEEKEKLFVSS
jgi:DNA topoisomerase-1